MSTRKSLKRYVGNQVLVAKKWGKRHERPKQDDTSVEQTKGAPVDLSPEMKEKAYNIFHSVDEGTGCIETVQVRNSLQLLGVTGRSDDELLSNIEKYDADSSGDFCFDEFLQIVNACVKTSTSFDDLTLCAFVSLGGNTNRTGVISTTRLRDLVYELRIPINIEKLVKQYDVDKSGFVDYAEFSAMLDDD